MTDTNVLVGTGRSRNLVNGVAATLRQLERDAAGLAALESGGPEAAARRLQTFQRSLARALQQAHLESVQEMAMG